MSTTKVPVTERALLARINRVLAKRGRRLCKSRLSELGKYYVLRDKSICETHVDLEECARGLGLFHRYEKLTKG